MNYYYCSRACSNASQRFKNKRKRKKSFYFLQDLKLRCNFAPAKEIRGQRREARSLVSEILSPATDIFGKMVEWSITPVLKTGVPRGTGGSNPSLSAISG